MVIFHSYVSLPEGSTKECKYASIMKSTRKCCSPMFTISFTTSRTNSNDVVFTSCEHVIRIFSQWCIPVFSGIWKCVKAIQKLSIWTHTSQGMNINVQPFTSILSSIYIHTSQLFWCTQGDSFGWRQSPFLSDRNQKLKSRKAGSLPQNFSSTSSCWMVVVHGYYWLVVWNIVYCSIQLGIIIPTDFHIFQRDRSTTNQRLIKHVLVATVELKNGS